MPAPPPQSDYGWGVWLAGERRWAELPPRLCKPTPFNTNLTPALIALLNGLHGQGLQPELKRIPKTELKALREEHRE